MPFKRWFHPFISGFEAESLLLDVGYDGSFLARPSSSTPGGFTLSVRHGQEVTHIKIRNNGDCFDIFDDEKFATLSELVQHYMENNDQLRENNGPMLVLKQPLLCAEPTNERWFHSDISGKEAECLLLERGKNGSFLVRESQSKPGDLVLSVRTESTVTHIIIRIQSNKYDVGGGVQCDTLPELVEHYKKNPMIGSGGKVVILMQPLNATRLTAASINQRVEQLRKENKSSQLFERLGFWEEYESLQSLDGRHTFSRHEGQQHHNRNRNRFKNIVPFDHTRVILREVLGSAPGGNYINANYINPHIDMEQNYVKSPSCYHFKTPSFSFGTKLPGFQLGETCKKCNKRKDAGNPQRDVIHKSYIATQGCLRNTAEDFWNMIWQENTRVIVMATKELERGKSTCWKYWPNNGDTLELQQLELVCLSEESTTHYTLREILVRWRGNEQRRIYQFQFLIWPDHGVPSDPGCVLNFLRDVNAKQNQLLDDGLQAGPICVHCSSGIGRTGTFIVIDMILDQINRDGLEADIDIMRTIQMCRTQRSGMVQTEAQYQFVYYAVQQYIQTKYQRMRAEQQCIQVGREYSNIKAAGDFSCRCN